MRIIRRLKLPKSKGVYSDLTFGEVISCLNEYRHRASRIIDCTLRERQALWDEVLVEMFDIDVQTAPQPAFDGGFDWSRAHANN